MSEKFSIPQNDRNIALSLLLELAMQKGTLSASLEAILLLLTLSDKERELNDNRAPYCSSNNIDSSILYILKRYEDIACDEAGNSKNEATCVYSSSPTESFLRYDSTFQCLLNIIVL